MATASTLRDDRQRRLIGIVALTAILAAVIAVLPITSAQAGLSVIGDVAVTPTDNDLEPEFAYEYERSPVDSVSCETDIAIFEDGQGDDPTSEPIDTPITVNEDDDTSGTFSLPELSGGYYDVQVVTCEDDGVEIRFADESIAFARLLIDKVVEGDAPEGTSFEVEALCIGDTEGEEAGEATTYARTFDAQGGSTMVVLYAGAVCEVTETEDGGAESTSIENSETDFTEDPIDLTTTVTNTFPEAEEPEEEEEEDEPEAEPAEPVEDEPDYTG